MLAGLLLVSLLSVAALYGRFFFLQPAGETKQAVITIGGKVVKKLSLLPSGGRDSFIIQGRVGAATVEVDGGRIRIQDAPCPGQVCVKQQWIQRPGQAVACVPGEILIRIEGAAPLDAVTR